MPTAMGSTATFALGGIGGFNGRALRAGDTVRIHPAAAEHCALSVDRRPDYDTRASIRVIMGPHTSPDFFTDADIEAFLAARWKVHYNSSRTGVRLTGPQPTWARPDGGEAGLHPSNIHDTAYAFGSVDFTGDMPVILGPDGPSLGGFVCPAAVVNADRWKLGQLAPGDTLRFVPIAAAEAARLEQECDAYIENLGRFPATPLVAARRSPSSTVPAHRVRSWISSFARLARSGSWSSSAPMCSTSPCTSGRTLSRRGLTTKRYPE